MSDAKEHKVIYLSPSDDSEREWCEDDVWENSVRYNIGSDYETALSQLAALREELEPKTVKELLEHEHVKALSAKQINDVLSKLHEQNKDLQQRLADAERRNAALTQQVDKAFESAARWVESRRDDYVNDYGSLDPETGTVEFPGNGEEYVGELGEIAEGLRALNKTEEAKP